MRKSVGMLFLTALVLFGLTVAPAAAQQRSTRAPFLMGLAGGATLSDFQNPDSEGRWGGTAGLFLGKATFRTLSTFEVNWVQKGGGDFRIDYLELPLTFGGVGRTRSGTGRARIYTGVAVGFKLGCGGSSGPAACDALNGTEWSIPIGMQVGRWTGEGQTRFIALDARYYMALSDLADVAQTYHQTWMFRIVIGKNAGRY